MSDPFRYVGEKLLEPAGPNLWPLAVLYFDPETRGLKVAMANVGAELVKGHGRKIGVIMEKKARELCQQEAIQSRRGSAPTTAPAMKAAQLSLPLSVDSVEPA